MFILCCLVLMICCRFIVESNVATIYDQRQTGDLNVQIELKNLQVVALMNSELDDYTDYDYFYDYADFTIKPGNRPTTSSTTEISTEKTKVTEIVDNSSVQHSTSTTSSTFSDEIGNSTEPNITIVVYDGEKPTTTILSSSENVTSLNSSDIDKTQLSDNDGSESSTVASSTMQSTVTEPVQNLRGKRRCRSGYIPDYHGRCQPLSALLLKIMP